ncbi:hypothetical protein RvY_03141 [Ramazzottius varieornatus]|uniref:Uncharacterized protein n=1 Tax=Ramazzottius varieornatus TaxID=947166 RepID=A0A1D1UU33_RAMVA|nr:hypothetical protein RvY_03141 [Ramazzottius varieornatus]
MKAVGSTWHRSGAVRRAIIAAEIDEGCRLNLAPADAHMARSGTVLRAIIAAEIDEGCRLNLASFRSSEASHNSRRNR